jgi:hypothetical protein
VPVQDGEDDALLGRPEIEFLVRPPGPHGAEHGEPDLRCGRHQHLLLAARTD